MAFNAAAGLGYERRSPFNSLPDNGGGIESAADLPFGIVELLGESKRVLFLGDRQGLGRLQAQGCDVVAVGVERDVPDLLLQLGEDAFDAAIITDVLTTISEPIALLQAVKRFLHPGGYVLCSVPNAAHLGNRLALLQGSVLPSEGNAPDAPARRPFTLDILVSMLERAGYGIGLVERQQEVVQAEVLLDTYPGVPATLLAALANDADARARRILAVGYPLPWLGLEWLQPHLCRLAQESRTAREEAGQLREELDALQRHLQVLLLHQENALCREKELRAQMNDAHRQLLDRDESLLDRAQELDRCKDELKRHSQDLALCDEELKHKEEELRVCRWQLREISTQAQQLEARLARFRGSLVGRCYRLGRAVLRRFRPQ